MFSGLPSSTNCAVHFPLYLVIWNCYLSDCGARTLSVYSVVLVFFVCRHFEIWAALLFTGSIRPDHCNPSLLFFVYSFSIFFPLSFFPFSFYFFIYFFFLSLSHFSISYFPAFLRFPFSFSLLFIFLFSFLFLLLIINSFSLFSFFLFPFPFYSSSSFPFSLSFLSLLKSLPHPILFFIASFYSLLFSCCLLFPFKNLEVYPLSLLFLLRTFIFPYLSILHISLCVY